MGVVGDIERRLSRLRSEQMNDDVPELRTSTMTHVVWAPDPWLARARRVLHGLAERHPARTIFLIPVTGSGDGATASVTIRDFDAGGGREVLSEVIEVRLSGRATEHPASIVLPLLISDLPAFCRWRGEPAWGGSALEEIVGVCDRFVVDSNEWPNPAAGYAELPELFDRVAVSDLAWRRTLPWRARIAELWPGVRRIEKLRVEGPKADALLLAGWLRSRLRREIALTHRRAEAVTGVWIDGAAVPAPFAASRSGSDLLSAELDTLARDRVYEAAVARASRLSPGVSPARARAGGRSS
jgi:glucose-6-phosphate dehydrogenase assembly protein OpcA